jgi:hypothetical protein
MNFSKFLLLIIVGGVAVSPLGAPIIWLMSPLILIDVIIYFFQKEKFLFSRFLPIKYLTFLVGLSISVSLVYYKGASTFCILYQLLYFIPAILGYLIGLTATKKNVL